jgi:hypothetical protein
MRKLFARWSVMAAVPLLAGLGVAAVTPAASADAASSAMHTRSGPVINTLVVGDSYTAGNGSGGVTYNVSPDDPSTPPAPYSGPGCWRKYQNASMIGYNSLDSTGFYINRACSGKETTDVLPEVADLAKNSDVSGLVDLIVYSAGGNDVNFGGIAQHCILTPGLDRSTIVGGKRISLNCYNLLAAMKSKIGSVIASERTNLLGLLKEFPNANIVVDGYPMLVSKKKNDNTVNYAYAQLAVMMPEIEAQQAAMVSQLAQEYEGGIAFNDVFARFGGVAQNHGVYSADPWLYGLRPNTDLAESLHPTPTGQSQIAAGIVAEVKAEGWFSDYPQRVGKAVNTFNFIPGSENIVGAQLADNSGRVYTTTTRVPRLASCWQQTFTVGRGWVGASRNILELVSAGPDTIRVNCSFPRAGDIVSQGSASYLVTGGSGAAYRLQSIPTTAVYFCLAARSGVRHYTISKGLLALHQVAGTASCSAS